MSKMKHPSNRSLLPPSPYSYLTTPKKTSSSPQSAIPIFSTSSVVYDYAVNMHIGKHLFAKVQCLLFAPIKLVLLGVHSDCSPTFSKSIQLKHFWFMHTLCRCWLHLLCSTTLLHLTTLRNRLTAKRSAFRVFFLLLFLGAQFFS